MKQYMQTIFALSVLFLSGFCYAAQPQSDVNCTQIDGKIEIKFNSLTIPKTFTVLRPDGGMVYISTELGRDYRVKGARVGTLIIDPTVQIGEQFTEDGSRRPRVVFDDAGIYTLLFAGKGEVQEGTVSKSCKVSISNDGSASMASLGVARTSSFRART